MKNPTVHRVSLAHRIFESWLLTCSSVLCPPGSSAWTYWSRATFLHLAWEYFSFETCLKALHPYMNSLDGRPNVKVPWAAPCGITCYSVFSSYLLWQRWGHLTWRGWSWVAEVSMVCWWEKGPCQRVLEVVEYLLATWDQTSEVGRPVKVGRLTRSSHWSLHWQEHPCALDLAFTRSLDLCFWLGVWLMPTKGEPADVFPPSVGWLPQLHPRSYFFALLLLFFPSFWWRKAKQPGKSILDLEN